MRKILGALMGILVFDLGALGGILWLFIPFVLLTALGSFAALFFLFGKSMFAAVVYAVFAAFVTIVVTLAASKVKVSGDIGEFMKPSRAPTAEERRREAREKLEAMREDLLHANARKSRLDFYSKALLVLGYMALYTLVLYLVFGLYPSQAFFIPLWALVAVWVVILMFVPRAIILLLLLALTGLSAIVSVMGPQVILQFLPYLMTMPMMMFMNFFIMFGPLMFFNIRQIQVIKPGEGEWGVTFDEIRGQDEAKKQVISDLSIFLSPEKDPLFREKGILMVGPPGVGKTLTAKAVATHLNAPVILTTGSAFVSTFIGIGIFVMLYLKMRAEGAASEFGRCIVFLDEAEQILQRRFGMNSPGGAGTGSGNTNFYAMFDYDEFGAAGDLVFDSQESLARAWARKYPAPPDHHPIIMGAGMGMGGANMALPVYLAWLDGVPAPPLVERMWRGKANQLLDVLFVPPYLKVRSRKVSLRVPRAKPIEHLILHLAATNVPDVIDPAMLRPGRFGRTVHYVLPGEEEREDIADLYFAKAAEKDVLHPDLINNRERLHEFAQATVGFSPAQIMQAVYGGPSIRKGHIARLNELKERIDAKEELSERDQRFWNRFHREMEEAEWDNPWATWDSLMESLRTIRYGMAKPTRTSPKHRETTAYHEFAGHLLPLYAFAREYMKPTILSVMPRGQALGMVAHVPIDEHDPQPQRFWEAMLRVMVGSVVAERIFFGDNQPGVVSDLERATQTAAAMVGRFGMVPRKCTTEEKVKYIEVGQTILSTGGGSPTGMMGSPDPSMTMMGGPKKSESVALLLGQAFVDDYRLITKNRDLVPPAVEKLLAEDEVMGRELEELWRWMGEEMGLLTSSDTGWPTALISPKTPFYGEEE